MAPPPARPSIQIRVVTGRDAFARPFGPATREGEIDLIEWRSAERAHRLDCPWCATGGMCSQADRIRRGEDRLRAPDARAALAFEDPSLPPRSVRVRPLDLE
jgi:hypothetical protein